MWALEHYYVFGNAGREGHDGVIGSEPTSARYEPVTSISWRDMLVWCNAYSEMSGLTPCYTYQGTVIKYSHVNYAGTCDNAACSWTATGYRLPSEGEWQFAASCINGTNWNLYNHISGDLNYPHDLSPDVGNYAWYSANSSNSSHQVGTKLPNQLGFYDMSGNIFEWCWDHYYTSSDNEIYPDTAQTNYKGSIIGGNNRVFRGGGFHCDTSLLTIGHRFFITPDSINNTLGLRVARSK